jgi:hypothetical protein
MQFDSKIYTQKLKKFYEMMGSFETGHACRNFRNFVLNVAAR